MVHYIVVYVGKQSKLHPILLLHHIAVFQNYIWLWTCLSNESDPFKSSTSNRVAAYLRTKLSTHKFDWMPKSCPPQFQLLCDHLSCYWLLVFTDTSEAEPGIQRFEEASRCSTAGIVRFWWRRWWENTWPWCTGGPTTSLHHRQRACGKLSGLVTMVYCDLYTSESVDSYEISDHTMKKCVPTIVYICGADNFKNDSTSFRDRRPLANMPK